MDRRATENIEVMRFGRTTIINKPNTWRV